MKQWCCIECKTTYKVYQIRYNGYISRYCPKCFRRTDILPKDCELIEVEEKVEFEV